MHNSLQLPQAVLDGHNNAVATNLTSASEPLHPQNAHATHSPRKTDVYPLYYTHIYIPNMWPVCEIHTPSEVFHSNGVFTLVFLEPSGRGDTSDNGEPHQVPHIKECLFQGAPNTQLLRVPQIQVVQETTNPTNITTEGLSKVGYVQY